MLPLFKRRMALIASASTVLLVLLIWFTQTVDRTYLQILGLALVEAGSHFDVAGEPFSSESRPTTTTVSESQVLSAQHGSQTSDYCQNHARTTDMLVVMKTGATEAYDKIPIHLLTTLRCVNDSLIVSDLEMDMAGHHIVDVLADIDDTIKDDAKEFKLYRNLRKYQSMHADLTAAKSGMNAWRLDRFKRKEILVKAWRHRPDVDWYVFIDADTYVIWDNLRTFLDLQDPRDLLYIGSHAREAGFDFAHGGSGYVISRAAMQKAVAHRSEVLDRYDTDVASLCCGDVQVAQIMLDQGIPLTKAWPLFNWMRLAEIPFGPSHWCQPVITLHHVTGDEVSQLWAFERTRRSAGNKIPIMAKDLYHHFFHDQLSRMNPAMLENWDNMSRNVTYVHDPVKDGTVNSTRAAMIPGTPEWASKRGPEECMELCFNEGRKPCYGWHFHKDGCTLDRRLKIGGPTSPDKGQVSVSGWNMRAMNIFIKKMDNCREGPEWHFRDL